MNRNAVCVMVMLTVAPIAAATALVAHDPAPWGGSLNPLAVIVMALFGLLTVPLWFTYVPALILTPKIMHKISRRPFFRTTPAPLLMVVSLAVGPVAGVLIMAPILFPALADRNFQALTDWVIAGAVSGAITLAVLTLLYRLNNAPQTD